MKFSYAAAYLSQESNQLFYDLGVEKQNLHMTIFFDDSGSISMKDNIDQQVQQATIAAIKEWETPNGTILVAELKNCDWSLKLNQYYCSLGITEALPHSPHLTLIKYQDISPEIVENLQSMVGKTVDFDKFVIKTKDKVFKSEEASSKMKIK